jgi:putative hydrolase of the HAD superfamily
VCVLTNGTDTIADELAGHQLTDVFDTVFNSAEIGYAKPDLEVFAHVLTALDVSAQRVLYLDDSPTHVRSAAALGIRAEHFTGVDDLRSALGAHGIPTPALRRSR